MVNSQVENLACGRYFLPGAVDPQEHFLGQVLGLVGVADQVVHDADEAVLVALDQFGERGGVVVPDPQHEPDVRVAEGHLGAGLPDRHADSTRCGDPCRVSRTRASGSVSRPVAVVRGIR